MKASRPGRQNLAFERGRSDRRFRSQNPSISAPHSPPPRIVRHERIRGVLEATLSSRWWTVDTPCEEDERRVRVDVEVELGGDSYCQAS